MRIELDSIRTPEATQAEQNVEALRKIGQPAVWVAEKVVEEGPGNQGESDADEQGEAAGEKEMSPEARGKLELISWLVGRYGEGPNPDSLKNLERLGIEDPGKFDVEVKALAGDTVRWGYAKGMNAHRKEIFAVLKGDKTLKEASDALRADIAKVSRRISNMEERSANGGYRTNQAKASAEKQMAKDREYLQDLVHQYNDLSGYQKDGELAPIEPRNFEGLVKEPEGEENDGREDVTKVMVPLVGESNYEELKMKRRQFMELSAEFLQGEAKRGFLRQVDDIEALEQKMIEDKAKAGFMATPEGEKPTPEQIAEAARLAHGNSGAVQQGEQPAQQRTQQEQDAEYRQGMVNLAKEAKGNPGRFDKYDEELMRMQDEEKRMKELEEQKSKEGRLDRVFGKLRGRVLRHKMKKQQPEQEAVNQGQDGESGASLMNAHANEIFDRLAQPVVPVVGQAPEQNQNTGSGSSEQNQEEEENEKKPEVDLDRLMKILMEARANR